MVAAGVLKLVPLRTHLMVADALTKSLPSPVHLKHREIMLDHVPFSFAARTLRRSVGGVVVDPSLSLSTCRDARGEPQYSISGRSKTQAQYSIISVLVRQETVTWEGWTWAMRWIPSRDGFWERDYG